MAHHVLFRCSIGNRCQKRWFYQDNLNRTTTVSLLAIISLLVTEQESIIPPWSFPTCWHLLLLQHHKALVSWSPGLLASELRAILARDTRTSRTCFHLTQSVILALMSKTKKVQKRKCYLASVPTPPTPRLLLDLILPKVLHLFS